MHLGVSLPKSASGQLLADDLRGRRGRAVPQLAASHVPRASRIADRARRPPPTPPPSPRGSEVLAPPGSLLRGSRASDGVSPFPGAAADASRGSRGDADVGAYAPIVTSARLQGECLTGPSDAGQSAGSG